MVDLKSGSCQVLSSGPFCATEHIVSERAVGGCGQGRIDQVPSFTVGKEGS